jgi:hypothetical protein
VSIPASKVTNNLQVRTAAAVQRHCRHKLGEAVMSEARARYESIAAIPRNIVILVFSGSLWYGLQELIVDPHLNMALSVPVAIMAWATLWYSYEMMFIKPPHWMHQRDQAIYQAMESMPITIEAEPTCV